ncbi:hypothetical protein DID88_000134 [Monilinia fructigena]|uniref:BTB domain-containing protein n=1 Tax=Monilinia fructigena TaxID=38457 RepID=A0A395ILF9_9HELO|nr:hypothetical protein DID88_000134 [Monilinia fructigena]
MSERNIIDPDGDCIFCLQRVVNTYTESERIEVENEAAQDLDDGDDDDNESILENSKTTAELQEVKFLVSSKHMMLVSPVFRAMFRHKNGFKDGEELHAAGIVNVPLPDDNPDAFLMLLNIIHCQDAKIPLAINLQSLCDLAVLVDKYRMHGAVRIVSNIWIDALMEQSNAYKVDDYGVLLWLCIAWVFNLKNSFRYFTRLLMVLGDKPLSTRLSDHSIDLPIPERVVGMFFYCPQLFLSDFNCYQDTSLFRMQKQLMQVEKS